MEIIPNLDPPEPADVDDLYKLGISIRDELIKFRKTWEEGLKYLKHSEPKKEDVKFEFAWLCQKCSLQFTSNNPVCPNCRESIN